MDTNYGSQGPQDPPWQGQSQQMPPWMQPQQPQYQPPPQQPQQGAWQQPQQQVPQYQPQQWQGQPQYYPPQQQYTNMPQPPYGQPQQYPPQQPNKKRRGRLPLIIGVIVIVLLFACVGAGALASRGAPATKSTVIGNVNGTTPTAVPTQASAYKVGDVVKVSDTWNVTVISAKADPGNTIYTPKVGMRYLVLNIAMKNLTTANHSISSIIQFTLRDNDGTKYDVTIYPDAGSQIDGNVDGGQPAKGVIVYEVPATIKAFHLTFESNPFDPTTGRAVWDLNI